MKIINKLQKLSESEENQTIAIQLDDLKALLTVYESAIQARDWANSALDEKEPDFYSTVDDISYILDSYHPQFVHLEKEDV